MSLPPFPRIISRKMTVITALFLLCGSLCISVPLASSYGAPELENEYPRDAASNLDVESFNATLAYNDIAHQLDLGYRIPGSNSHQRCIEWIIYQTELYGQVSRINFTVQDIACSHILLKINPGQSTIVSFGAHFDSRAVAEKDPDESQRLFPIEGANDGASGVAVMLELARLLSNPQLNLSHEYWFLFIDAEDQGKSRQIEGIDGWDWCEGSQWFANELYTHPDRYFSATQTLDSLQAFILLDMVGGLDVQFIREYHTNDDLMDALFETGQDLGYADAFSDAAPTHSITDDHVYFHELGIPTAVLVIPFWDTSQTWAFHHTHNDTLANIDIDSLHITGRTLLYFLAATYEDGSGSPNDSQNSIWTRFWDSWFENPPLWVPLTFLSITVFLAISVLVWMFRHTRQLQNRL